MAGKKVTPVAEETVKPTTQEPKAKVYHFKSENPTLTVAYLGIQFVNGKAETSKLEVAKALAKCGGVELIDN